MTLAPFYAAPDFVKVHILAALTVTVMMPVQFLGFVKGSAAHRASGYVWLCAMLVVALSSFWIKTTFPLQILGYGPIHLLSLLALYSIVGIIRTARAGHVIAHQKTVRGLSIGFSVAGIFTLLPSRIMGQMLFG